MSERTAGPIEVDDTRPAVPLPRAILHELYAHARHAYPEECCGVILGDAGQRYARVIRCHNEMTRRHAEDPERYPRDGRSAFFMSPEDLRRVFEEVDASGEEITAIYHSHVGERAHLSAMDLEYVDSVPSADHIVLAVVGHDRAVAGAGIFRREGGDDFVGRAVQPDAPE